MAEQTADKVKFDKEEDIKPLLIAFRKIFEPITKSMEGIAKIPEEIKRIADNIAKDLESGVPRRVANGAEKIAENPDIMMSKLAEFNKRKSPEEAKKAEEAQKHLERNEALLKVLQDKLIPSKLDENNQAVKLTEKEIIESRKEFITEKKEQSIIEKKIESASKEEGLDAEQQATKIQELQQQLEKSTEKTSQLETMLGSRTPQEIQQQERPGFQAPAFIAEPLEVGKETLMAGPNAVLALKNSFENNISGPIKSLIDMNKKHYDVMEDYGETGDKANKITILKMLVIATGIAALVAGLTWFFRSDKPETLEDAKMSSFEKDRQEEYNRMRNAGVDQEESALQGKRAATKEFREGFIDIPGILGLRDEETDILNTVPDSTIEGAKKRMVDRKLGEGSIFSSLNADEVGKSSNMYVDNSDNSSKTVSIDSSVKPEPMKKDTVSQNGD